MDVVKLGLIGMGEWPKEAYLPILKELDAAEVVAVAARSDATRQLARQEFGEQIATYPSYRELLHDDAIDAVMVALPNDLHAAGIEAAIASGKHVFYEPPIGHTQEEIHRILATMEATDAVVQTDLELHYLPVVRRLRDLLASTAIGEPLMAEARLWANWGYGGGKWNQNPEAEGFFPWLGCWYLDLLDCVFGAPPTSAKVAGGYAMNGRLMDHGWATLDYGSNRIGQFEFSLVAVDGLSVSVHVLGSKGEAHAELTDGSLRWRDEAAEWREETHDCSRPMHGFVGMRESITGFVQAIQAGTEAEAGLAVARRVHEAMLMCHGAEARARTAQ